VISWNLDPTSRAVVLAVLRQGPIPRAEVARRIGLSSGSITRLTGPLVERGILIECSPEQKQIGRPSLPLLVADEAAAILGVKVVPGGLHAVRTGMRGVVQSQWTTHCDTSSMKSTAEAIRELMNNSNHTDVAAVGVSLAAAVDSLGTLRAVDFLGWGGGNLSHLISDTTGIPCATANDVNALTLAEHWFGHGREIQDFAVLTVGNGVGSGVIINDELMMGAHGSGSTLGATWLADGRPFGQVLSSAGIATAASHASNRVMTHAEALLSDDDRVHEVLNDASAAVGHLAALTAAAYDPHRILLTGDGIGLINDRMSIVHSALLQHRFFDIDPPELVVGQHNFFDWAVGAAALAIKLVLST